MEDLIDNGFYRLGRLTETAYSGLECVVWFGTLMVIWKMAERTRFFEVFLMLLRGGLSPEGNVDRHAIGTPDARGAGYVEVDAPDSTGTPGGASVAAPAADVGAPVQSLAARFDELAIEAAQSRRARDLDGNPSAPGSRAGRRGRAPVRCVRSPTARRRGPRSSGAKAAGADLHVPQPSFRTRSRTG